MTAPPAQTVADITKVLDDLQIVYGTQNNVPPNRVLLKTDPIPFGDWQTYPNYVVPEINVAKLFKAQVPSKFWNRFNGVIDLQIVVQPQGSTSNGTKAWGIPLNFDDQIATDGTAGMKVLWPSGNRVQMAGVNNVTLNISFDYSLVSSQPASSPYQGVFFGRQYDVYFMVNFQKPNKSSAGILPAIPGTWVSEQVTIIPPVAEAASTPIKNGCTLQLAFRKQQYEYVVRNSERIVSKYFPYMYPVSISVQNILCVAQFGADIGAYSVPYYVPSEQFVSPAKFEVCYQEVPLSN